MIQEVYILQESSTRDGLNLDYICASKESLIELAKQAFMDSWGLDGEQITRVGINDIGDIYIHFIDSVGVEQVFRRFSYIKRALK